jgi:hypothetical protein
VGVTHTVSLPPGEALESVVSCFVGGGVYAVESRAESSVTFVREKSPDFVIGCALLLLGLIPGLIYLGLAGGTVRLTVIAEPLEDSRTHLTFGASYWLDRRWIAEWWRSVEAPTETPPERPRGRWHPHPDD